MRRDLIVEDVDAMLLLMPTALLLVSHKRKSVLLSPVVGLNFLLLMNESSLLIMVANLTVGNLAVKESEILCKTRRKRHSCNPLCY